MSGRTVDLNIKIECNPNGTFTAHCMHDGTVISDTSTSAENSAANVVNIVRLRDSAMGRGWKDKQCDRKLNDPI